MELLKIPVYYVSMIGDGVPITIFSSKKMAERFIKNHINGGQLIISEMMLNNSTRRDKLKFLIEIDASQNQFDENLCVVASTIDSFIFKKSKKGCTPFFDEEKNKLYMELYASSREDAISIAKKIYKSFKREEKI